MGTEVEQRFLGIEWHDATLLEVSIDRTAPGERDEVLLRVEWQDGRRRDVRFTDCYALDARMNFGVVAIESIRDAGCFSESPRLTEVRREWGGVGVELPELLCFELTTNSTGSVVRILATGFEVLPERDESR